MDEFSAGDLIEIYANNKYGRGIKISYKNSVGINNKLIISIGGEIIEYDIGIVHKHTQYAVVKDDKNILLLIDGYIVKGKTNPMINYPLEINNKPALFNKNGLLKGNIDFLVVYNKQYTKSDILSIKKFLTNYKVDLSSISTPDICKKIPNT